MRRYRRANNAASAAQRYGVQRRAKRVRCYAGLDGTCSPLPFCDFGQKWRVEYGRRRDGGFLERNVLAVTLAELGMDDRVVELEIADTLELADVKTD